MAFPALKDRDQASMSVSTGAFVFRRLPEPLKMTRTNMQRRALRPRVLTILDAIVHQLIADAPGYLVVDMRNIVRSSAQARRFTPRKNLRAMAVVTHSMLGRMLLGAFVSIARLRAQVKVFTCPDKAYAWVHRQYIEESLMWRIDGRQTQKNPRLST
jgi:hypothetical protein